MNRLFNILDHIDSSDYAEETLANTHYIVNYAEAVGESISYAEAERIQAVGLKWRDERENGNGEWSRMFYEAMSALDDDATQVTGKG